MPELTFAQPARRNLLAPVLIALAVLGMVIAALLFFTPRSTAELTILKAIIYPTHTVYKSDSIVVGADRSQDELYIVTTLRVQDRLKLPLFLKDFTGTLITADGEKVETSAVQQQDLENLYTSFPALRPLATTPLLRETKIDSGKSDEGMVILHFPVSQDVWNHRRSATLNVAFYHQGPISVEIPQATQASSQGKEITKP